MGKLNQIDKAAESKGKGIVALWQFIKFIVGYSINTWHVYVFGMW